MSGEPIQIKRYPNRRYYARQSSKYVSLSEIEAMVQSGSTVEITDSQTGEDLTRAVLTQIILERQPEKMALFPSDMLHFIVRSNELMADFLRDYFQHSLTYLDYLQRHSSTATTLARPMHWVKAWLDGIRPRAAPRESDPGELGETAARLAERVELLEARIRQLESTQEAPAERERAEDAADAGQALSTSARAAGNK